MKKRNFIVVILFGILACNSLAQEVYTVKNQKIEFSIDSKGNLVSLKNLQTGFNYASGRPIWRLYFDTKKEKDIEVLAKENKPSIKKTGDIIIITYEKLKTRNESFSSFW